MAKYLTAAAKARQLRRNLLIEMIMEDPKRRWSSREMADEARKLPWFQTHMPNYGHMTAHRDWLVLQEETAQRRKELSEQYAVSQLDTLEDTLDTVLQDLDTLGTLEDIFSRAAPVTLSDGSDDLGEGGVSIDDILKYTSAKQKLVATALRLMERQGKIVPIEIEKKIQIEERRLSIDAFLKMDASGELKAALGELDDGIIEGDYAENE